MAEKPNHDPAGSSHSHHSGGQNPPETGVSYFVKIDGQNIAFDHQLVTGRELLAAVGHECFQDFDLYLKLNGGGRRLIPPDEVVDLGSVGIEKFNSIPKKRTDGREQGLASPLTADDIESLDSIGLKWEVVEWQGNWLLKIKNWSLPIGYHQISVDVGFVIPITYPSAQLDMFYFFPALSRVDGVSLVAATPEDFNGEKWQRWSRHRTQESAWRPGIDNISTHLGLMDACLRDELVRGK